MNNYILLIDDRDDFAKQFVEMAKSKMINTSYKKSFAGLKEVLPKYQHNFAAIVLDIKCLLVDDQEKEDAGFITIALSYLDQHIPNFPRFILTGDDKEFESINRYFQQEKVFLKTPQDLNKLLDELKYCVDNSEILKIKRENSSVFELFSLGKMNNNAEIQLLKIIQEGLNQKEFGHFKGILADVRSFQESIYKSINIRNPSVVPISMFKSNGMIKFNQLMKHLDGNPDRNYISTTIVYQNSTISNFAQSLYWACGEYIHEDPNRKYYISDYAVKSIVNNLMELLMWSKQF